VAQFLIDAGQYLEADPWLVQAIERDPAARWYWFLRGRTAYQAGDLVLSRAVLEETIARFPDWGLAYSELALTLMDSDRPLEALVWIDKAILYMDSPNAWYFVRKAEIHRMIDQNEEALGAYQDAWEINPAGVTPIYVDFLRHQYENPELAVEVLQKTIGLETEPDRRLEWQILLGDFLREEQQIGEAEQVYIAILELQPDNIPALIGLGWIYYLRGDGLEAARAVILEAIAIDPSDSRGHFAMGQILSRVGLFAEADAWLAQAIEREPEARWYWFERGRTAYLAGDLDRSLALFDATIDRFPEWAPPHAEKAQALIELNHPVDALSSIEEALRYMAPPNPWYFVRAAQIYEILGEKEKALEAYLAALEIDPENGVALNGVQNLEQESPSNPEGGSPQ
jgi:tetratricopeptide (TPR) repeat protein